MLRAVDRLGLLDERLPLGVGVGRLRRLDRLAPLLDIRHHDGAGLVHGKRARLIFRPRDRAAPVVDLVDLPRFAWLRCARTGLRTILNASYWFAKRSGFPLRTTSRKFSSPSACPLLSVGSAESPASRKPSARTAPLRIARRRNPGRRAMRRGEAARRATCSRRSGPARRRPRRGCPRKRSASSRALSCPTAARRR